MGIKSGTKTDQYSGWRDSTRKTSWQGQEKKGGGGRPPDITLNNNSELDLFQMQFRQRKKARLELKSTHQVEYISINFKINECSIWVERQLTPVDNQITPVYPYYDIREMFHMKTRPEVYSSATAKLEKMDEKYNRLRDSVKSCYKEY